MASGRNGCVKNEKRERERVNSGSFLTSAELANHGVKWVRMADC